MLENSQLFTSFFPLGNFKVLLGEATGRVGFALSLS